MAVVAGRDLDYATLRAQHMDARCRASGSNPREPSYILYTSGTTGKPKGVQRDTGGYAVALASSMRRIFCVAPGETMFTTSDIGWVVGHSYIVYGAADQRLDDDHVRGPADPARSGHLVEDRRRAQGQDDVQLADGDPRAEEAGHGVHEGARPLDRCATCSSPASRSTSRPRAGRPTRSASRSSTTTGRPRAAGRSSRRSSASRRRRASSAARRSRSTATTCGCCTKAPARRSGADEKGVLTIVPPLPPGCMTTVWGDDERFVKTYFSDFKDKLAYSTFDWAIARRRRLLLRARPHRRRDQRRRPPPRHARDRGGGAGACRHRRSRGRRRRRCAEGPDPGRVRGGQGRRRRSRRPRASRRCARK